MSKKNIEDIYPLSPMQQGMLFHTLYDSRSGVYFEQSAWKISGRLEVDFFEQAWQRVLARHPALRTAFMWEGLEEPLQVAFREVPLPVRVEDWQSLEPEEQNQQLEEFLQKDLDLGFELTKPPLMRLALLQVGESEYFFIWSHHHLLLDGWSLPVIFGEVFAAYESLRSGNEPVLPPARPYRDYIAWLKRQDMTGAERYWREILEDVQHPTPLPMFSRPGATTQTEEYHLAKAIVPEQIAGALRDLGREQLTLNTVMLGAWALLLNQYSGLDDVLFGTTVSGRPAEIPDADTIVGLCINTLPLRARLHPEMPVTAWLKELQTQQSKSRLYEYVPLVKVHGWSQVPRDVSLFDSLLVFENYPTERSPDGNGMGLQIQPLESFTRTNYPITIAVSPGKTLGIEFAHDGSRLDRRVADSMLRHFQNILCEIAADPSLSLSEISALTPDEQNLIIHNWNATDSEIPDVPCVHTLIANQAEHSPDAIAAQIGDESLTYRDLNERANQLAHYLRKRGVKTETRVGVCVERSLEMIVAILGILKSGGAYLPMDPATPAERLKFMLGDADVRLLITQDEILGSLSDIGTELLCIDSEAEAIGSEERREPAVLVNAENLAYVIYTSGSTGIPKGVAVAHRSLVNYAWASKEKTEMSGSDRALQFLSLSFDAAAEEIYPTLLSGACIVLHPSPAKLSGRELLSFCKESNVTVVHFPVAYWHQMVNDLVAEGGEVPASIRVLVTGGETPLTERLVEWMSLSKGRGVYVNAYGPTEATVATTMYSVRGSGLGDELAASGIPIGRPLGNMKVHILDDKLRPVPVGAVGTLYIGGAGLARGYLDHPDVTAEKFVPDPFDRVGGRRLYNSGDLARYLPDGNIEYLKRIDDQVKVRGYRIEPGEIETRLSEHPFVGDCVAVVREDREGLKRLVAYVVFKPDGDRDMGDLREYLGRFLPDYMVPSAFVELEEMPLSPTGKVDRRALPDPTEGDFAPEGANVSLRTPTEELLAGIWNGLLGTTTVNAGDSFFDLGGHSILATQMLSRIRDVFRVDLPLQAIFESPTLRSLAATVESVKPDGDGSVGPPLEPVSREGGLPLSFAQQRLWFIDQLAPGEATYNIFSAYRIAGPLDSSLLEKTLNEIIRRHEVLRTVFSSEGGKPAQVIRPFEQQEISVTDLSGQDSEVRERALADLMREESLKPFNLEEGPLFRASLLRLETGDHMVFLTVHHIIADGWSMSVLIQEVAVLYQAFLEGKPSPLPELRVQYADFANWQTRWLQGDELERQLSYWRENLAGIPPVHEVPTDHPRPAVQTFQGGRESVMLSKELSDQIRAVSRKEGVTIFMTLLAGFQALLHRYSRQSDIVVGSPIAGRRHSEVEKLMGFFVNNLALRTRFEPRDTFRTILRRVRETALGAYAHQDIPFEKLVEELHPARDLSHSPLFQIMFVLQNIPVENIALQNLTLQGVDLETTTSNFDLSLVMQEGPEGYHAELEYSADLFTADTILRMLDHFTALLTALVGNPDEHLAAIPLLSPEEEKRQLVEWNQTLAPYPADRCVHEVFASLAKEQPSEPALTFAGAAEGGGRKQLTYEELNRRANQLARHLRKLQVGPECLVGVCTDRSLEMVIGILGILKAGGAFVPLDPAYPQDRLSYMLSDSGISVLLTQEELIPLVPSTDARILCLDRDWPAVALEEDENLDLNTIPDSLAYVIYTSGSTGKPKGTMLRHGGLCNLATVHKKEFGVGHGSNVLQFSSLSFDASVWELVMALLNGAGLILSSKEIIASGHELVELMRTEGVTTVTLPPSVLAVLPREELPDLETIILAGEKCPGELVEQWGSGRKFFNAYGPTETTVCASMHLCSGAYPQGPPIGTPIANFQLYILDQYLQPVPVGVPGELHMGGVGLARGYHNRPEVTAERFMPNPFSTEPGARLYKSGDLCRYLPDGSIDFMGRVDHQVKVRGFRIELGEIESVLGQFSGIRDAVVLVREDVPGDKRLVAYLVPEPGIEPSGAEVKDFLRQQLPEYMIPTAFLILEAMPLTPNNKIDRKALPAPEAGRRDLEIEYVAPRNDIESTLAEITGSLLNVERVGVHDNFFDLGGHSLLATQFISRVRDAFQVNVALRVLFEKPHIAEMAMEIEKAKLAGDQPQAPKIKAVSRESVRVKRSEVQNVGEMKR